MKLFKAPHQLLPRLHYWVHLHPYRTYAIIGVGLITSALLITAAILLRPLPPPPQVPKPPVAKKVIPKPKFYSTLTGREVADKPATTQVVTAIMIENSPDARPQSGIKDAGIVYEAIAEGGITRFLALYQEDKPQLIGPVRSLRMYYVDWLAPYDASVAHIGGSAAALTEIRNGSYRDIDQFFNAPYYWRSTDRYPPHNVYTSFEKLDALNQSKGYTTSTFQSFDRTDDAPAETPTATSIEINFSSALFNTQYAYDATNNVYLRSIGGMPSEDREEGRISPSVVIALDVNMVTVFEDGYRQSIDTVGSGNAYVFQNGTVTECTWQKASRTSPLQLIGQDGKPLSLIRGQTWIAAVPNGTGGVAWK
ncbi:DUF3048 domain-containing protein [Candidatus Saccharibacteria bacterium]|nr:DUF3048 domain-containing protein [Candidatus Saccharibacteria bacterium]